MKATCPDNPEHDQFYTVAHVMEEWVVDANGDFVAAEAQLEVTHGPDPDNLWVCYTCGANAEVTP